MITCFLQFRLDCYIWNINFCIDITNFFQNKGLVDFHERSSLKIAYLSIFFLAVVLSAAYSASLISFLTSDVTILPFHSLESLVADGTYQLIVLRGTADYDFFVNSGDPLGKKIRKFMLKDEELPVNIIEGVRMRLLLNYRFVKIRN
ncbi:glutamate receptor U1-like [Vespa velutina]|uniref:glutamate receptor U1-like n=1 Tax=Vespa velutina TaxID=202808 RepID=UPI001FB245F3|nr:glutamate receptor U1-like [Vespa velutina]